MHDINENYIFRKYIGRKGPKNPTMGELILPVLMKYEVTLPALRRKDRRIVIVKIRDEVIGLLHKQGFADAEIAYYLHAAPSTVNVARQRWNDRQRQFAGSAGMVA